MRLGYLGRWIGFFLSYVGHVLYIFVSQKICIWYIRQKAQKQSNKEKTCAEAIYCIEDAEVIVTLYNKHPYLDCWAERMARKKAGQLVNVPFDQWSQGPKDLWPWW